MTRGWIAVDFDGTLSRYDGELTGEPIDPMVRRVKGWLARGEEVRIFTARVSFQNEAKNTVNRTAIEMWCVKHLGRKLDVTCVKDYNCKEIWDDKAIKVNKNLGLTDAELVRWRKHKRV